METFQARFTSRRLRLPCVRRPSNPEPSLKQMKMVLNIHLSVPTYFRGGLENEQAGTGPSRRHIQGSKIAKRLPSVKYSFTEVENQKFFEIFFLKKLHTKKIGPSGALTSHNAEKLKGRTL